MELISKELYQRYREEVLRLSNSFQYYEPAARSRGLTDRELGERLGLREEEVTQIRVMAELDTPPIENWLRAPQQKREKALRFIQAGFRYKEG